MSKVTINHLQKPRTGKVCSFPGGTLVTWNPWGETTPSIYVVSSAAHDRGSTEKIGALNLRTGLYLSPDVEVTELLPGTSVLLEVEE